VKIQAVVPVKPFDRAKSRLSGVLSPVQRAACSAWMLANTLKCLKTVTDIEAITVISRDPAALAVASDHGVNGMVETRLGLNPALHQAATRIGAAAALLVLPADLPLLTAQDVEQFIHYQEVAAAVVIAPDRHCQGTNALLLASSKNFRFRFGPNSYHAHQQEACRLGLGVVSVSNDNLAFDLDTPEDLEIFGRTVYSPGGAECWSSPES